MRKRIESTGFRAPTGHLPGRERRTVATAELVAGAALALSTMVVATVLSVGIAHAGVVDGVVGHEGSLFGVALMLALIFIGLGGISALPDEKEKKR